MAGVRFKKKGADSWVIRAEGVPLTPGQEVAVAKAAGGSSTVLVREIAATGPGFTEATFAWPKGKFRRAGRGGGYAVPPAVAAVNALASRAAERAAADAAREAERRRLEEEYRAREEAAVAARVVELRAAAEAARQEQRAALERAFREAGLAD